MTIPQPGDKPSDLKPVLPLGDDVALHKLTIMAIAAERDSLLEQNKELRGALISMCEQYLSVFDGKMHHDFMSAGEHAFEVLGWPMSGQPVDKQCLCEVEGCGMSWTSGFPDPVTGKYRQFCYKHYALHTKGDTK